jgi:amphi-Trp domain-containing protein
VDDEILSNIFKRSPKELKKWFHKELKADAFDLYHGPIGNCFRTKYRVYDHPLTEKGITELHQRGIYAIVHGHLNQKNGQRMIYREGMLHFQCDCSLDRNTRQKQGLSDPGLAVTIFRPNGLCEAISSDYDKIKVFNTEILSKKKDIKHSKVAKEELVGKVIKGKVMKKTKKAKFEHESLEDQESIIKYLETIIDGFKKGSLTFGNNKKSVELSPQGLLKLKINVSSNSKKVKLGLNMEWKEKATENTTGDLVVNTEAQGPSEQNVKKDSKSKKD